MNFNKSLLNFIFKEGLKNDQSSVKIKDIVKSIDEELSDEELTYSSKTKRSLSLQEYAIETKLERTEYLLSLIEANVTKLDDRVRERLVELKLKLLESKDLVRQALLSERTLTGESYTLQIPLKKEYATDNTTATIEDEVVFGIGFNEVSVKNKLDLSTLQLRGEENTLFKVSTESETYPLRINFEENFYKPYNQLKISVTNLTQTGVLFIKFDKAEVVSVLNKDGYETIEPFITDRLTINISHETQSFSLRFANNSQRIVTVNEMYFTEAIYNKKTVFETVPFQIDKDLSFLTVQTCDNYSTRDVSINYEISINNSSYRAFRPNGKLNTQKIQSIIRTREVHPTEVKIEYTDTVNGSYRFYNENLVSMNSKLRVFSGKMGVDFYSLESYLPTDEYEMHLYVPEDFTLKLSPSMFVYVNDLLYSYENTEEGAVSIQKGLNTLKVSKNFWKEVIDLDNYSIISVETNKITVIAKDDKTKQLIEVDNYFDTSMFVSNSIYLQLLLKNCLIYLKEEAVKRKYDKDYIEYLYKDTPSPIYVYSEAYQTTVNTIQFRVTLSSEDHKICPYVSKMLVRGV